MAGSVERAQSLLSSLERDLQDNKLSDADRTKLLEQLKIIGRNPAHATPIFERESIHVLCRYAFDTSICLASREAMRCLANAMFLNEACRQMVIDLGYPSKAAERMKNDDRVDEFLSSRILFFASYTSKLDIASLISKNNLVNSVQKNLQRSAQRLETGSGDTSPITSMAFQETLKLIPNLVYHCPDCAPDLVSLLEPLSTLIIKTPLPSPPLQPPITHLINALLNVNPAPSKVEDVSLRDALYPESNPTALTTHLIGILSSSMPAQISAADDITLSPLLSLIRTLHTAVLTDDIRSSIRGSLLPSEESRSQPLGKDDTLPSKLLRAAASPTTSNVCDVTTALLYEMSDEDSATLVRNIGYGYAVGILTRLGKDVDPAALGAEDTRQDSTTGHSAAEVNPITGQRVDAEVQAELDSMTEEEKEREAERLFVLFERLKATGVMDVVNPVEQAMREGKFE